MERDSYKTTVHTSQTLPETLLKDIEIIFRTHTMTKDLTINKLANGVTRLVWSYEDEKLSEKYELFARLDAFRRLPAKEFSLAAKRWR